MRGAAFAAATLLSCGITGAARAGTLRVCASVLLNFDDTPSLALPSGLLFTEWGPINGDLRSLRLDPDYPPARATGQHAVVLAAPVSLTASSPCADAPARAVMSTRYGWRGATVPANAAVFLASDTLGPDGPRAPGDETRSLYAVLTMNVLAARPVTAIADAETVP